MRFVTMGILLLVVIASGLAVVILWMVLFYWLVDSIKPTGRWPFGRPVTAGLLATFLFITLVIPVPLATEIEDSGCYYLKRTPYCGPTAILKPISIQWIPLVVVSLVFLLGKWRANSVRFGADHPAEGDPNRL